MRDWEKITVTEYDGYYEGSSGFKDLAAKVWLPKPQQVFSKKYLRVREGISQTKHKPGIYIIHFIGGWYVGQSADIRKRLHSHNSNAWSGPAQEVDMMWQMIYTEYTESSLLIKVFYCAEEHLNFWEAYFIGFLQKYSQDLYNKTAGADNKQQKLEIPDDYTDGMKHYVDYYKTLLIDEEVFKYAGEVVCNRRDSRVEYVMRAKSKI